MSAQREALLEVAAVQLRAARADIDAALALIGVAREDNEPKQQAPNSDEGYVNVFGGRMRVGGDDTPANGSSAADLKPMTRRMLDDLQQRQQAAATGEPDGTTSPNNGAP